MPSPSADVAADPVPLLSPACVPPLVAGPAVLTTAAMRGAAPQALIRSLERSPQEAAGRLLDASVAVQLDFRRAEALALQNDALTQSLLFRLRRSSQAPAGLRLLALCNPGDLMANTPLDFITNQLDVRLDLLFVAPGRPLPAVIPDHDLAFFAAAETDAAQLDRLCRLFAAWPRPALNDPSCLPMLRREVLARALADIPSVLTPKLVAASRAELQAVAAGATTIGELLPGGSYPVLLRPVGTHAGNGLQKLDGVQDLRATLSAGHIARYYLSGFVDYRSPDGLYRKYRIALVDGLPHLCHMAASESWMVHYLNAGMADSAAKRADEARAMASFDTLFAARHRAAFQELRACIGCDYYAIDCAEMPDGRLLVFEADTAAIVHAMDPLEAFAYKQAPMRRLFDAFATMLHRRLPPAVPQGARRPELASI